MLCGHDDFAGVAVAFAALARPSRKGPVAPMGRSTRDSGSTRGDALGWVLVIAIVSITAFWPALDGEFLNWDDDRNFLSNESYRGFGPEQWAWAWTTDHVGVWQPFSWMLLGIEHEFASTDSAGHPNPYVYHMTSLGLHIVNGWLLFAVLASLMRRAVGATRANRTTVMAAGAVAALFTVHPLRVEAVAWISAQPYLPAIGFSYLSIWAYLQRFDEHGEERPRSLVWLGIAFLCYLIACGFKAVAVTTPLLLLIADFCPIGRQRVVPTKFWARVLRIGIEKLPFFAVAIAIAYMAAWAKDVGTGRELAGLLTFDQRLAQTAWGLCFYLLKSMVPIDLSPFYELPIDIGLFRWPFVVCFGGILFVTAVCLACRRRAPFLLAAWLAYIVVLLPNSGMVQISQQLATDRYSYFALLGPTALLAGLLAWRLSRSSLTDARSSRLGYLATMRTWLVVIVALAALVVLSRQQSTRWQNSQALWSYALAVDPKSAHAACQLGQAQIANGRYGDAIEHLQQAIDLRPDFAFAYVNLAAVQLETNQIEAAIENYERALSLGSNLANADKAKTHFGLAIGFLLAGNEPKGLFHVKEASRLGYPKDKIADLMASY